MWWEWDKIWVLQGRDLDMCLVFFEGEDLEWVSHLCLWDRFVELSGGYGSLMDIQNVGRVCSLYICNAGEVGEMHHQSEAITGR